MHTLLMPKHGVTTRVANGNDNRMQYGRGYWSACDVGVLDAPNVGSSIDAVLTADRAMETCKHTILLPVQAHMPVRQALWVLASYMN
eukprot:m.113885 g.113885  ORF g.113885 m.113885 type:complete len:87 (-) comp17107_c0_seq1:22-282(-)